MSRPVDVSSESLMNRNPRSTFDRLQLEINRTVLNPLNETSIRFSCTMVPDPAPLAFYYTGVLLLGVTTATEARYKVKAILIQWPANYVFKTKLFLD